METDTERLISEFRRLREEREQFDMMIRQRELQLRERERQLQRRNDIIQAQANMFHNLKLQMIENNQNFSYEDILIGFSLDAQHTQLVDEFMNDQITENEFVNRSNNIINELNNIFILEGQFGNVDVNYEYDEDYYSDEDL